MKVKCYGDKCLKDNIKHEKDTLIENGGKRYCKSCLDEKLLNIEKRNELYQTIKDLYNIQYPTGMMLKQIRTFKENYGYTYENIKKTLLYISTHKTNINFNPKFGLNIITYFYDEAVNFYKVQEERFINNFNRTSSNEVIVVNTKAPDNTNKIIQERTIDLSSLL